MNKSTMKKSLIGLMSLVALVSLSACPNNGSGTAGTIVIDPVVYAWYDVYGNGCGTASQGPSPGCNFYWYGNDLVKIIATEDPYFSDAAWTNNVSYDTWDYYLNGVLYEYQGWAWLSNTGILYDENGNALNKKKGSGGRDVVRNVAQQENDMVQKAGKQFASQHNLSLAKGVQIARALNDWAKIGKQRSKTEKDFAEFSQRLYGLDYNRLKGAVLNAVNGDKTAMKQAVADAAKNWGTNEETMKQVLKKWYKGQVPGLE